MASLPLSVSWQSCQYWLKQRRLSVNNCLSNYASTSLNCAGIQWWKSVLFCCWAAINLVGEMSNEEQDTPPPTLSTIFLPHCVKSSTSLLALDEQWGAEHPTPYPTHPFPSSLCKELCMSDNMHISCLPAAVLAYWDPRGLAHFGMWPL